MQDWSLEPWRDLPPDLENVERVGLDILPQVVTVDGTKVATCALPGDATRIVTCVNACQHVEFLAEDVSGTVRELVEALQLVGSLDWAHLSPGSTSVRGMLFDALAKVRLAEVDVEDLTAMAGVTADVL